MAVSKLKKFAKKTAKSLKKSIRNQIAQTRKEFGKATAIALTCELLEIRFGLSAKDCKDVAEMVVDSINTVGGLK